MPNPFVSINSTNRDETADLPLFKEYGYDFDKKSFLFDGTGKHITVTENEALKVWIYKALMTERYRYLAYHDDYGISIEPYQGTFPNTLYTAEMIKQNIREGIDVNPYIKRINSIEIDKRDKDDLFITVDVTTIYDEESLVVSTGRSI